MFKKSILFSLVMLLFCFSFNVQVEAGEGSQFYIGLKPGAYFPKGDIVEGYKSKTGFGLEMPLGYRFNRNVGAELSLGWYQTDIPQTLSLYPITLDVLLSSPIGDFTPYIRGGGGYYWAHVSSIFGSDKSDSAFGFQAGLGVKYKNFGIEGRYISARPSIDNVDLKLDGFLINIVGTF